MSVENFHDITPISSKSLVKDSEQEFVYRGIKASDGLVYCLRRISSIFPLLFISFYSSATINAKTNIDV